MAIRRTGTPNWKLQPGEILREEFLKPMKLSAYALAKAIHVPGHGSMTSFSRNAALLLTQRSV
jgi:plasmid maintenance system antidote protein VapI